MIKSIILKYRLILCALLFLFFDSIIKKRALLFGEDVKFGGVFRCSMNLKIHLIIKCLPVDFKYINPRSNSIELRL